MAMGWTIGATTWAICNSTWATEQVVPYELDLPDYPNEAKCILWADIDNDGDQDLLITYRLAANRLYSTKVILS